jgi:predicted SPOUT superfamily RNA methylase MTH1
MDKEKLAIAIPASSISDTPHLREKTSKIGLIGRAAAIFRVNEIIVYPDNAKLDQRRDIEFIGLLLNYLETPQYLRKRLFRLDPDLEFAGILPPLRTPNHPLSGKTKHLKVGEYREGVVLSEAKEGLLVDIGVQQPALLRRKDYSVGDRLTLQIVNLGVYVEVQPASREEVPFYWGYRVRLEKRSLGQLVMDGGFDLRVATARVGDNFMGVADKIGAKWVGSQQILVAFGAPSRGLHEIVQDEGLKLGEVADFVVNMVPMQGTATVRMEEALLASLAILNMHFRY